MLGRYTHRVAISNNRILDIEDSKVRFPVEGFIVAAGQRKPMTLDADEFIRRFLIHVLPSGFQRILYYGLLGNRYRKDKLARCRELLGMSKLAPKADEGADRDYRDAYEQLTGRSLHQCPALPPRPYGAVPISSADHFLVPLIIDTSWTTQQPSRSRSACLSTCLTRQQRSRGHSPRMFCCHPAVPGLTRCVPPGHQRREALLHHLSVIATPPAAPARHPVASPRASRRHSIPIAPAPCERLSPTAF